MNKDLYDVVKEKIFAEVGGGDPEIDYATIEAIKAFAEFLHSRRWHAVPEMIHELRDMLLQECGDFRHDLDPLVRSSDVLY